MTRIAKKLSAPAYIASGCSTPTQPLQAFASLGACGRTTEVNMGFYFSLKDANIVAYLTDRDAQRPPRLVAEQLFEFLGAAKDVPSFISSDEAARARMQGDAERAFDFFCKQGLYGEVSIDERLTERVLRPLRRAFADYDLYGLTIRGGDQRDDELDAFARNAAFATGHRALFLISQFEPATQPLDVLDPFPALAPLVEDLGPRPGILLWDRDRNAIYADLDSAQDVLGRLIVALRARSRTGVADVLQRYRGLRRPKRILHISDLHLGTRYAAENQELLLQQIERVMPSVDRVVITGDLFDEPRREYSIHYKNFSFALRRLSDRAPVVIPGNHDQKKFGNVGHDFREVAGLDWQKVVVDEQMGATFFCFDSSRDADWARGKVSLDQKRDVAAEYGALLNKNPNLDDYLNVALVHHHPFSFEHGDRSLINRALRLVGKTDEHFLCMEDGSEFVEWCARRRIPLILHGHKHEPRHVTQCLYLDGDERYVTAVGCGTSLGAEGKPLSYNVVTWDHEAKRVGVSCFADPGDGSGFASRKLSVLNA